MAAQSRDVRRSPPVLLLAVFLVVTTGILIAGYTYYRNYRENFKRGVERTLLSIADLKASELIDWRAERLGDGEVFFENSTFLGLTRKALDGPAAPEAREQLLAWLRSVEQAYQYDRLFILDAQGVERLSTRDVPGPPAAHFRDQVPEVLRSGRVSFFDFHRDAPDLPMPRPLQAPRGAAVTVPRRGGRGRPRRADPGRRDPCQAPDGSSSARPGPRAPGSPSGIRSASRPLSGSDDRGPGADSTCE